MFLHPHPKRWLGTIDTYLHESFGVGGLVVMSLHSQVVGKFRGGNRGVVKEITHHSSSLLWSCTLLCSWTLLHSLQSCDLALVLSCVLLHSCTSCTLFYSCTLLQEHLWPVARASTPQGTSTARRKRFYEQVGLSLSHEYIQ